jgi:hypothetical protein
MGPCCRWETFFVCPVTIAAPPSKSGKTTKLTPNGQLSPLPATPPSLPCQWQQQKNQHSAYCRSCLETHPRHLPSPLQESPHARPHDCKGFCSQFGVSHMCFCHFFASLGKLPFVFLIHFSRHSTFTSRLMRPQWQRSSRSSQHRTVSAYSFSSFATRVAFLSTLLCSTAEGRGTLHCSGVIVTPA